ncbi:MAG: hypothetical protein IKQ45_07385 [Clostridia bacterium]|nr:hypothetical protein [Clostridia bacterium]
MENIAFAKYDMDFGCVYTWTEDCNLILIDCDEAEKAYADNMLLNPLQPMQCTRNSSMPFRCTGRKKTGNRWERS